MSVLTFNVTLEPLGERYQAVVRVGHVDPSTTTYFEDGELLSAIVREAPHDAAVLALQHAAHDVAHDLARALVAETTAREAHAPSGIGLSGNLNILSNGLVAQAFTEGDGS